MNRDFLTTPLRVLLFTLVAAAFAFILYGADNARKNQANQVVDWLPKGFQETREFNWFLEHFYEGDLLMVSWDGCKPDDPSLEEIAEVLTAPLPDGSPALYWKVMTTPEIMRDMTSSPISATDDEALERMRGWIVSQDGTQGCMLAFFSQEGYDDSAKAVEYLYETTERVAKIPRPKIRAAGTSLDALEIDRASENSQRTLLPIFLAVCVAALFVMLNEWRAVFVVFIAAIFNEELSSALIYFCGSRADSVSLLSASLMFILTISGSLHLLNYYRDCASQQGKKGAVVAAMKKAFVPCALSCLTTVMGLSSLAVGKVEPIRKFGVFSTLALLAGSFFFFVFIGAFVEQFPVKRWLKIDYDMIQVFGRNSALREARRAASQRIDAFWARFPDYSLKFPWLLIVLNLAALGYFVYQLPKLQTTVTFRGMFPNSARVIKDYDYLEERVGGLIPIEVVMNVPISENPELDPVEELGLLAELVYSLEQVEGVDSSLSALNFIPQLPDPNARGFAAARRAVFNRAISSRLDVLRDGCLFDDRELDIDKEMQAPSARRWRVSLRVRAGANIEYGDLLSRLRAASEQTLNDYAEEYGFSQVTTTETGGVPLAHKAQSQLLSDLINSYASAFVLILATLIVLLRSFFGGIIAMLPNILPSALVFGSMAALGWKVDMGAMMTASVALGVSVDSTIHFITWYRKGLLDGYSRRDATRYAYRECGSATTQTTLICGGGMLVFAFSEFLPISKFATMIATLLTLSLYGSLVMFPAFLVAWTGVCFRPSRKAMRKAQERREAERRLEAEEQAAQQQKDDESFRPRDEQRERRSHGRREHRERRERRERRDED